MAKYLIVDLNNCVSRCSYARCTFGVDTWTRVGLTLDIMIKSINKTFKLLDIDHVVFAVDSRSWRYRIDKKYKIKRKLKRLEMTESEKTDEKAIRDMSNDFCEFIDTKTNCTFLKQDGLEADDIIAGWCDSHPNDQNYIFSSDSDFYQLLTDNVNIVDPMKEIIIKQHGVFSLDGKESLVYDKKTNEPVVIDPEYSFFLKTIRGDDSDSVPSAFPRVRETRIKKVYNERFTKGVEWNNFMKHEIDDPETGNTVTVGENFKRNQQLIGLHHQPDDIKLDIKNLVENKQYRDNRGAKIFFTRFLNKYELVNLVNSVDYYYKIFFNKDPNLK